MFLVKKKKHHKKQQKKIFFYHLPFKHSFISLFEINVNALK